MNNQGEFYEHYKENMQRFYWVYTWASSFNFDDTKLFVGGVTTSEFNGEICIYNTNRKSFDGKKSEPKFVCRVSNDPFDLKGSWLSHITPNVFIAGTFHPNHENSMDANVWVCRPTEKTSSITYESLNMYCYKKILLRFRFNDNEVRTKFR